MKRLLAGAIALILSVTASATTYNPIQLLNPAGSSVGQAIISTGPTTVAAWGSIPATSLASQAANTVVANVTGSAASPTAFAMPSCTGAANALGYTSGTGIICNSSINAATLGGATFASPGAIGGTTAAAGKFTTLQATSAITPSSTAGIVGTATNDNANAGSVGEYITSTSSFTGITTATNTNITSISLTAGDWDVTGNIYFLAGTGDTITIEISSISTTSATFSAAPTFTQLQMTVPPSGAATAIVMPQRISLASTTTVYLVGYCQFSGGTTTTQGIIRARRIR